MSSAGCVRNVGYILSLANRKLEAEADEKLQNVYHQLLQAGVDKNESDREARLKETLASLQRIFPGGYFCEPFHSHR